MRPSPTTALYCPVARPSSGLVQDTGDTLHLPGSPGTSPPSLYPAVVAAAPGMAQVKAEVVDKQVVPRQVKAEVKAEVVKAEEVKAEVVDKQVKAEAKVLDLKSR